VRGFLWLSPKDLTSPQQASAYVRLLMLDETVWDTVNVSDGLIRGLAGI
jgi:hypothetical protein